MNNLSVNPGHNRMYLYSGFLCFFLSVKLLLIYVFGNATPFWDQWDGEADFLYKPFLQGRLTLSDLLAPHNEHRIFCTRLLSLLLLKINGSWNPLQQMVINAVLHGLTICCLFHFLFKVLDNSQIFIFAGISLVLLTVPFGWENTLAGFQSQFYFVLLFSILTLWYGTTKLSLSKPWFMTLLFGGLAFLSLAGGTLSFAAVAATLIFREVCFRRLSMREISAVAILSGCFFIGYSLTPVLEHHATLRAVNVTQFLNALKQTLAWPLPAHWPLVVLLNAPAIIYLTILLRQPKLLNSTHWFLAALVFWSWMQCASISVGRAMAPLAFRYLDVYIVGVIVNLACWFVVGRFIADSGLRKWWSRGLCSYVFILLLFFVNNANRVLPVELKSKLEMGKLQEVNTRTYLNSKDTIALYNKPLMHIPYPDARRLQSLLDDSIISLILPYNIRAGLQPVKVISNESSFTKLGYYPTTPLVQGAVGSYTLTGDKSQGQMIVIYKVNNGGEMQIPVSGYPMNDGNKLELSQHGLMKRINFDENPKESWVTKSVGVHTGEIAMITTDSSTTSWLAVAPPTVMGRLDVFANKLLNYWYVFAVVGLLIILYGVMSQSGSTTVLTNITSVASSKKSVHKV